ncbi:MAG TPA: hypothetical protein VFY87_10500 [Geminicoccaceae bacterium]|nr:hypothetical protein [Geminicoccaceae bacterium]
MAIFNGLEYIASYADLIAAFGAEKAAGQRHYDTIGRFEGRVVNFDALEYTASYRDLGAAFGANEDAGAAHYILHGRAEGRNPPRPRGRTQRDVRRAGLHRELR